VVSQLVPEAIAQVAFWAALMYGLIHRDLPWELALLFVVLWIVGYLGFSAAFDEGVATSYLAALDLMLLFAVFQDDLVLK